jgi:hypothetical protein
MKGSKILVAFFLIFTSASLLIPSPIFPGNVLCAFLGGEVSQFNGVVGAFLNGVFYGVVVWLVFVGISRRLVGEE